MSTENTRSTTEAQADATTDTSAGATADAPTDPEPPATDGDADGADRTAPMLLSRILVTWVELVLVGFLGTGLASQATGPPQFVVYLATTLVTVGVLFWNVDRHVQARTGGGPQ
jgi:hypothetical protein